MVNGSIAKGRNTAFYLNSQIFPRHLHFGSKRILPLIIVFQFSHLYLITKNAKMDMEIHNVMAMPWKFEKND